MPRNLDMTALRSFVTVAETGGVTRAAGFLNLTQSAVSMQIKRLEESLDQQLLWRQGRGVELTRAGEQLLSLARRMLELNDEVCRRLTSADYEGSVTLGVPHDIVYPHIPQVLRQFAASFPRVNVTLLSSFTRSLKSDFANGKADIVLTTEHGRDRGGETLVRLPLVWMGAPDGVAWQRRPLRLAFERDCIYRPDVIEALDGADIDWEMSVESDSFRSVGAMVMADLAVHALLDGTAMTLLEPVPHGGALPDLTEMNVNLYVRDPNDALQSALAGMLRHAFSG